MTAHARDSHEKTYPNKIAIDHSMDKKKEDHHDQNILRGAFPRPRCVIRPHRYPPHPPTRTILQVHARNNETTCREGGREHGKGVGVGGGAAVSGSLLLLLLVTCARLGMHAWTRAHPLFLRYSR